MLNPGARENEELFPHSGRAQIGVREKKSTKQGVVLRAECGESSSYGNACYAGYYKHFAHFRFKLSSWCWILTVVTVKRTACTNVSKGCWIYTFESRAPKWRPQFFTNDHHLVFMSSNNNNNNKNIFCPITSGWAKLLINLFYQFRKPLKINVNQF